MFRAIKTIGSSLLKDFTKPFCLNKQVHGYFSSWLNSKSLVHSSLQQGAWIQNPLSKNLLQVNTTNLCLSRNVTKYSLKTGKKKSVATVLVRFFRLHNGLWIRRIAGCHKKVHKKNWQEKYRARQHVFCTRAQCIMLDKMITGYHKKRKYFIDDPFEPYHDRHNLDYFIEQRKSVNLKKYNFVS